MKTKVFLSYSHADSETAAAIERLLKDHGIDCWVDHRGIPLGEAFDREIERAIGYSGAVVWLVSASSVASDYVRYELTTALHRGRPVMPVRLEPIELSRLPSPLNIKLGNVQAWDYFAVPADDLGKDLAHGVRRLDIRRRRKALSRMGAVGLLGLAGTLGAFNLGWSRAEQVVPPARPVPERLASLACGALLQTVYSDAPPAPAGPANARAAFQLDLKAKRKGESQFVPLSDGGTLASGVDNYRVAAKADSLGYAYIFQVDTMGKVDWLFPRNASTPVSSGANPLRAGQAVEVPAAGSAKTLYLDTTVGVEHMYAVFSATRWPKLETALANAVSASAAVAPPDEPTRGVIDLPNTIGLRVRGVGGVREDTPRDQEPGTAPVGDRFQGDGYFLVLERWFRHVAR